MELKKSKSADLENIWMTLATLSGFPDPYLTGREASYQRWSNTYSQQLIREDIRDLTNIQAIGDLETLYYLLPSKVGSQISVVIDRINQRFADQRLTRRKILQFQLP